MRLSTSEGGRGDASASSAENPEGFARILVVDDDEQFRRTVVRVLRRLGFEVVELDVDVCASAVARQQVDIVLIAADAAGRLDKEALRSSGIEVPAFCDLTKPCYTDKLEETVRGAVRARMLARLAPASKTAV